MSEKVRTENVPLDEKAQKLSDKLFVCEPPCDSWGVCGPCIEKDIFQAGYNLGFNEAVRLGKGVTYE